MIPFNKPSFGNEEEQAAIRVIKSGHLTQGEEVARFEEELAAFLSNNQSISSPYVVCVDSCTNALFLSLKYYSGSLSQGGYIYAGCPAMTFASVAHSIEHWGGILHLDDEYHAGSAYQLRGTNIWDCAHQLHRGMYKPGTIQCFSFYPNKVLSSAEGGAIATDNKKLADWLKLARNNGRLKNTYYDYSIEFPGWKMNMTDMQAAIGREQLKKLDGFNKRRDEIKAEYDKYFLQVNEGNYLYVITVKDRDLFMKKMSDAGVELSYHYKPLYDQPAYKQDASKFPYLESIKNHIVTLPLYPAMTDDEVQQVIKLTQLYAEPT